MKQLIKCHYNYLITKTTIITVSLILILIILGYILAIDIFDNEVINSLHKTSNYLSPSLFITKFLIIILVVFTFSYNFLPKNDQYVFLIVTAGIKKNQYIISKMILLFFFMLINIIVLCVFFFFFGAVFIDDFRFNISYLMAFVNLFILVLIYGLYSILLVQIIRNIFSPMISFALMLIGEMTFEQANNCLSKTFYLFFPSLPLNDSFYYGYSHVFLLVFILLTLNVYVFNHKDL